MLTNRDKMTKYQNKSKILLIWHANLLDSHLNVLLKRIKQIKAKITLEYL